MSIRSQLSDVRETLPEGVTLVAVSKTHAPALIEEAYAAGQRIFGESRPQELAAKYEALPKDIEWHMIGHLQTNKVKLIAPFVALIHSADSERLIRVINDEAIRNGRVIDILLEIHVADEETKSGWTYDALLKYVKSGALAAMKGVRVRGVMVHPGSAKDVMVNAITVASEFEQLVPAWERPEHTCGREGFYHPTDIEGSASEVTLKYILRDFDADKFAARQTTFHQIAELLNGRYGEGTVTVEVRQQYRNMAEHFEGKEFLIDNALEANREAGLAPSIVAVRGGTDGAQLTFRGLPCPNLATGGYNAHSVREFIPVASMEATVDMLVRLVAKFAVAQGA